MTRGGQHPPAGRAAPADTPRPPPAAHLPSGPPHTAPAPGRGSAASTAAESRSAGRGRRSTAAPMGHSSSYGARGRGGLRDTPPPPLHSLVRAGVNRPFRALRWGSAGGHRVNPFPGAACPPRGGEDTPTPPSSSLGPTTEVSGWGCWGGPTVSSNGGGGVSSSEDGGPPRWGGPAMSLPLLMGEDA